MSSRSVISNSLMPDENIVKMAKVVSTSPKYRTIAIVVIGLLLIMMGGGALFILGFIPACLYLGFKWLEFMGSELALTDKRVIEKHGFFNHTVSSMVWKKVESVAIFQSFFGRKFNYGTVNFYGVGGERIFIRNVSNPAQFRKDGIALIEPKS